MPHGTTGYRPAAASTSAVLSAPACRLERVRTECLVGSTDRVASVAKPLFYPSTPALEKNRGTVIQACSIVATMLRSPISESDYIILADSNATLIIPYVILSIKNNGAFNLVFILGVALPASMLFEMFDRCIKRSYSKFNQSKQI